MEIKKVELISQRFDNAYLYLSYLNDSLKYSWFKQYSAFKKNELGYPECFALIHPDHFGNFRIEIPDIQYKIQGSKKFCGPRTFDKCKAESIWLYPCSNLSDIEFDHTFPYSLGGPTDTSNRISLCKFHNRIKTNDIHLYQWEEFSLASLPAWFHTQLNKINSFMEFYRESCVFD